VTSHSAQPTRRPDLPFVKEFAGNQWFNLSYWPENRDRAVAMLEDLRKRLPEGSQVLDVGCANGFIRMLLADIDNPPEQHQKRHGPEKEDRRGKDAQRPSRVKSAEVDFATPCPFS